MRLGSFARLAPDELQALNDSALRGRRVPRRGEIPEAGRASQPYILLSGWAAQVRYFPDGRRQILNLLLPGDLIGSPQQSLLPLDGAVVAAITGVTIAAAPLPGSAESGLARAYAVSAAIERRYHLAQIARLGRLNADERIADFLLELRERVQLIGLANGNSFAWPVTQELLADCLGVTSVHVNRTVKAMRQKGLLELGSGMVRLIDEEHLRSLVDFHPVPLGSLKGH